MLSLESNRLTAASNEASMESNRLNFESFKLNEESRNLNLRSSNLNDKLRELNEKATAAACANQADAAKTSRSTRVNVEVRIKRFAGMTKTRVNLFTAAPFHNTARNGPPVFRI